MVNRKLVRPNLAEIKNKNKQIAQAPAPEPQHRRSGSTTPLRRRLAPPEHTSAEAFYYLKQMNTQVSMVLVLDDGSELRGHIEWYDRSCLKVHREDAPNLLIYKHCIRYLYKDEE
jgi:host factor-I protein